MRWSLSWSPSARWAAGLAIDSGSRAGYLRAHRARRPKRPSASDAGHLDAIWIEPQHRQWPGRRKRAKIGVAITARAPYLRDLARQVIVSRSVSERRAQVVPRAR